MNNCDGSAALHILRTPTQFSVVRTAADLQHPKLAALYEFWKERAGDRSAPARQNFDVAELKRWLPHLILVDVLEDLSDLRYRVIGTWVADCFGRDDTGKTMAEIGLSDRRREVRDEFLLSARTMLPYTVTRPFYDRAGVKEYLRAERVLLPLSSNGETCDKVLSGLYPLDDLC
jgi:hypothetical protein